MIKEILSRLRTFRWQKLLIIWAVFVAMAAILFAERSGIQYKAAKFKLNYLPRTEAKPAQRPLFLIYSDEHQRFLCTFAPRKTKKTSI